MNEHGRHAMETMKNHDPASYAQIEDPETYFTNLGDEMADRILDLTMALTPKRTGEEEFLDVLGAQNMAKFRAREMVYQEMIYSSIPPEPEEMEPSYLPEDEQEENDQQ
ncbi:hypothetical protein ABH924_003749 [Arthrobacter sp. GAS37]|uniref:hypothetical protein n=1 Tax=Arthrobacter sp. GAS37 TaxID=3156261 RepID=UPI003836DB48